MPRFLPGLRKSFLERNQLIIGVIGVVVVLLGSVLAVLLSGGVFANTYQVTAVFKDAAGIRSGDDVTVAGLDTGSIGAVRIVDGLVEIELKINSDVEMPADSDASIVVETLLGRKSVQLLGGNSDDMLAEGDAIPLERTTTPIEIDDLNDASVSLLERSDAEALQQLMIEVTEVTKGKEQEIGTVIDGLADVTAALDSKKDELQRLIESLSTLSTTFASRDDEIVSLIDRYNVVLGNLADRKNDLTSLVVNTDEASHEVADLVKRNRPVLDSTLNALSEALKVIDAHQLDIAATIPYLESAVRGYSSVGYSQDMPNRWANIFVQSLGPVGVDAIAGPCGLLDQALDEILGEDPRGCEHENGELPLGGANPPPDQGGGGNEPPALPTLPGVPSLPGDLGDLFDSVIGGVL